MFWSNANLIIKTSYKSTSSQNKNSSDENGTIQKSNCLNTKGIPQFLQNIIKQLPIFYYNTSYWNGRNRILWCLQISYEKLPGGEWVFINLERPLKCPQP